MAKKKPAPPKPAPDQRLAAMAGDGTGRPDRRVTRKPEAPKAAPKPKDDEARIWEERITRASKTYDAWDKEFDCKHLDAYYEGKQWKGVEEDAAKKKYVINLIFATVETQLPSLLFSKPKVKAEARPSHEQSSGNDAGARATLIEQALQTDLDDPKVRFGFETDLALRDAYPRFALVEVGYSADWVDNPNAGKPILKEDGKTPSDAVQPDKILKPGTKESVYVRRIDPATFRAYPGRNALASNDWSGYSEWLPIEDVKKNPAYKNTDQLRAGGTLARVVDDDDEKTSDTPEETQARAGMVKVWKIWDHRAKHRIVYAEGNPKLLQKKPYTHLPFAVLKFYERRNAFYPLPPIYNWMGPQDEINETREMQKVHRRRALRRYMHDASVEPTELEKLESTEDMLAIKVVKTVPPPIVALEDAPLDAQNWTELAASRDDLNQISGVSGESRNSPNAPTATQANIANVRMTIRESRARQQVANWLAEIARLILLTKIERMKLPFMVKRTIDPFAMDVEHVQESAHLWKEIQTEEIEGLDVDISIDVASLSPVAEDAQRNQWNVVLALLTNPPLATLLFTPNPKAPDDPSPLLRKTLVLNGITSDQEIREIWRVGQAILQQAAAAAAANAAVSKQPEPPKVSVTMKAEDIVMALGVVEGQAMVRELLGQHQPALMAAATAQPESPLMNGNGKGGMAIPAPGGAPTGTPTQAPATMGG